MPLDNPAAAALRHLEAHRAQGHHHRPGRRELRVLALGGGGAATCDPEIGPNRGADAIYDIVGRGAGRKLVFRSSFKIPRTNTATENCVAHTAR